MHVQGHLKELDVYYTDSSTEREQYTYKNTDTGAGETAHWLTALAVNPQCPLAASPPSITPVPGDPFSDLHGPQAHCG